MRTARHSAAIGVPRRTLTPALPTATVAQCSHDAHLDDLSLCAQKVLDRWRANVEQVRQSRPDSGLGFQVEAL